MLKSKYPEVRAKAKRVLLDDLNQTKILIAKGLHLTSISPEICWKNHNILRLNLSRNNLGGFLLKLLPKHCHSKSKQEKMAQDKMCPFPPQLTHLNLMKNNISVLH